MKKFHVFGSLRAAAVAACGLWLTMGAAAQAAETISPIIIGPIGPAPIIRVGPDLSGRLTDFSIKPTANGKIKVAGLVTLKNTGSAAARAVAATVYLSATSTLDSTAAPLAKLDLATYRDGDGKVKPGDKVTLPLKYKLSPLLAAGLSGQYIIVVLTADDYKKTAIVYGPLPKVP